MQRKAKEEENLQNRLFHRPFALFDVSTFYEINFFQGIEKTMKRFESSPTCLVSEGPNTVPVSYCAEVDNFLSNFSYTHSAPFYPL